MKQQVTRDIARTKRTAPTVRRLHIGFMAETNKRLKIRFFRVEAVANVEALRQLPLPMARDGVGASAGECRYLFLRLLAKLELFVFPPRSDEDRVQYHIGKRNAGLWIQPSCLLKLTFGVVFIRKLKGPGSGIAQRLRAVGKDVHVFEPLWIPPCTSAAGFQTRKRLPRVLIIFEQARNDAHAIDTSVFTWASLPYLSSAKTRENVPNASLTTVDCTYLGPVLRLYLSKGSFLSLSPSPS